MNDIGLFSIDEWIKSCVKK